MRAVLFTIIAIATASSVFDPQMEQPLDEWAPPIYNSTVWEAFAAKTLLNPLPPLKGDPYDDPNFNTTWPDSVCAVVYPDPTNRTTYRLETYETAEAAQADGAFVTHEHPCGYCSSTKDLAVYMKYQDLTNPVRNCGLKGFFSESWAMECLQEIGFSEQCSNIWFYDEQNTRKECEWICLKDWFLHVPNNVPANSTNLNPCIQCDEDKSGPIFKKVAARTRRDSGLKSSINRPANQMYHVYHYYY